VVLFRWLLLVVLSAVVVAGCGGSGADEPAKPPPPQKPADAATARKLQAVLDMQRESYDATGTAAAIVIEGRHFWSGGSGLANRKTRAPVTAETPFPIFGLTTMFVGGLAVKLAQEDRLELDDPLSRTLPDWPNADRITLRMLLNQTSGVGNAQRRLERETEARPRTVWTPEKTLSYVRDKPHGVPGKKWEYNNTNYILAGLVIEHATGRPVAEVLREQILDPLKLHDTVLQPQERPPSETAHGYGGPPRIARALRIGGRYAPYPSEASWLWTAGGMVASAPSVARFAHALLGGELLTPNWRRQLLETVPASGGYDGYGLGVAKGKIGLDDAWGAFGFGPEFITVVIHTPAKDITVAALSSGDIDIRLLATLLADTALEAT
jgi:D-alanyl-D-alanine carboxypeptidase